MGSDSFLAKYLSGNLPNTKTIPIAEFCSMIENNIGFEGNLTRYKHLHGGFEFDYRNLLQELDIDLKDKVCRYLGIFILTKNKRPRYDF